jgi:IclR family transcriptional regulator, pca regulon regulatory protein
LLDSRYSQSLERGLAILGCFTSDRPVLGIADIAAELEMSRSTTHRYVITLVALGYLEQGASHKYRLGLRGTDLGNTALDCTGIPERSHPHLEDLRRRTGHTTSVAVLDGTSIRYVDRVRSFRREQSEIDLGLAPGSKLPAYCTAMGKLLLAYLAEDERQGLVDEMTLSKRGPNTIMSKEALQEELNKIRGEGLAVNNQELAAGLCSIAAPVRDDTGKVVAAASIAAHISTFSLDRLVDTCRSDLVSVTESISARLGFHVDQQ